MSSRSGSKEAGSLEMVFSGAFVLGMFFVLAIILVPSIPPLQDYWEWVYQGVLVNRMLIEGAGASPFEFRSYPVPNSFVQGLIAMLLEAFSPRTAAKIVLLLYFGLVLLVYRNLRLLGPQVIIAPASIVLFSILFGSLFLNGYINNAFGNLVLLHFFTKLLRREPGIIETFAYSVLLFFCHAVSFSVFGLIIVISVLWREVRWQTALMLFPTGLMFLWYMARKEPIPPDPGQNLGGIADYLTYKAYSVAKLGPYHNFFYDGVGDFDRFQPAIWIGSFVNLLFAGVLVFIGFQVFLRDKLNWSSHAAFVSVAIIVAAYPFMPASISGVVNIGERFITVAVLLLIPLAVSKRAYTQVLFQFAGLLSLTILPVLAYYGVQAVSFENKLIESREDITIGPDSRSRYLFWHRPFLGAQRATDIAHVLEDGLSDAAPLIFTTSVIAPRSRSPDRREHLDRTRSEPQ